MADFETARRRMVDNQLRTSGITDRRLLAALSAVPRERFVPAKREAVAYADLPHVLGGGRTMASPAPLAKLVQLAEIGHADRVLDVGAGTGYAAALLAQLGAEVTALESDPELSATARETLADLGIANATLATGSLDGAGQPEAGFDVIVVEGALDSAPASLFPLLAEGGRLVAVVRRNGTGVAHVYVRSGGEVTTRTEFNSALPPLVSGARDESFVF